MHDGSFGFNFKVFDDTSVKSEVTIYDESRDMYMKLTPTAIYAKQHGQSDFSLFRSGKWSANKNMGNEYFFMIESS